MYLCTIKPMLWICKERSMVLCTESEKQGQHVCPLWTSLIWGPGSNLHFLIHCLSLFTSNVLSLMYFQWIVLFCWQTAIWLYRDLTTPCSSGGHIGSCCCISPPFFGWKCIDVCTISRWSGERKGRKHGNVHGEWYI